ncbi:MAG TPA: tRNA 5-methoxyuridine(34)/uridine 5-oxyacetic acid(34) synthase CmoB [Cyanobacteria bacterium UBA8803]|nr:tRNA 5-methoxyuridine(34)/uridine 5-oxyacetic acid(34) synthase CmoB [Cyanobacteria bacterium UBA9273]HBL62742.1 tRNA 5-methoxyuridine(34)/uridine 5-oxyacetic acid(34) synthase CmoB [Cyanobacteria bacterium UBA8803]
MFDETVGYIPPDYLDSYDGILARDAILALRRERQSKLFEPQVSQYRAAVQAVRDIQSNWFDFSAAVVKIGRAEELTAEQQQRLYQSLHAFCPWKKGPFQLFGIAIDAEWRSDWKWARILPHIRSLKNRRVADIGCHNGYFMLRMAHQEPACVIGFEPVAKHFWNFQLMQNIVRQEQLTFELLGVEHIHFYPSFFDTIFCLGILYHHQDPISLLGKMRQALAPQGEIVVDCQGIPGELPLALTPRQRYARSRGIWFLPTQSCLENWLARAGFTQIRCFFAQPLAVEEQRRTSWANIDSLEEFLHPDDKSLTVEGYPAPWRYYFTASK